MSNSLKFFGILSVIALSSANPALATEHAQTTFIVDPDRTASTTLSAKRNGELLVVTAHASRTVTLDSDVSQANSANAPVDQNYPLKAGQLLLGAEERPGIYCAPLAPHGLGETAPCLIDLNMDGKFDQIGMASFNSRGGDAILITVKDKFMPAQLKRFHSMATAVAYSPAGYLGGQSGKLRLLWKSDFKESAPGRPVNITFWLDGSAGFTGTGVLSRSVDIVYSGTPVDVTVAGISLRVLGFGADGEIHCDLVGIDAHQRVEFRSRPALRLRMVYYG